MTRSVKWLALDEFAGLGSGKLQEFSPLHDAWASSAQLLAELVCRGLVCDRGARMTFSVFYPRLTMMRHIMCTLV